MNHIDAKGKACPMPVMMAKKEMDTGCEALSITVDNAIAVQNLRNYLSNAPSNVVNGV